MRAVEKDARPRAILLTLISHEEVDDDSRVLAALGGRRECQIPFERVRARLFHEGLLLRSHDLVQAMLLDERDQPLPMLGGGALGCDDLFRGQPRPLFSLLSCSWHVLSFPRKAGLCPFRGRLAVSCKTA